MFLLTALLEKNQDLIGSLDNLTTKYRYITPIEHLPPLVFMNGHEVKWIVTPHNICLIH